MSVQEVRNVLQDVLLSVMKMNPLRLSSTERVNQLMSIQMCWNPVPEDPPTRNRWRRLPWKMWEGIIREDSKCLLKSVSLQMDTDSKEFSTNVLCSNLSSDIWTPLIIWTLSLTRAHSSLLIHTISNESWESKISIHYFTTTKKPSCPNTSDLDSWWANRSSSALWGSATREQHRWTFIKPRDQRALPVGVDIKRLVGLFWSQAAQSSLCVSQWGFLGFQQNRLESQDLCEGVTFPLVQGQIGVV